MRQSRVQQREVEVGQLHQGQLSLYLLVSTMHFNRTQPMTWGWAGTGRHVLLLLLRRLFAAASAAAVQVHLPVPQPRHLDILGPRDGPGRHPGPVKD